MPGSKVCESCGQGHDEQGHCGCSKFADGTLITAKAVDIPLLEIKACPEGGFWNHSGVTKKKGVAIQVTCLGGRWAASSENKPTSGDGDQRFSGGDESLLSSAPTGALLAKVGGDNDGAGSAVFHIGKNGWIPAELEGNIWLAANFKKDEIPKSVGAVYVIISDENFYINGLLA